MMGPCAPQASGVAPFRGSHKLLTRKLLETHKDWSNNPPPKDEFLHQENPSLSRDPSTEFTPSKLLHLLLAQKPKESLALLQERYMSDHLMCSNKPWLQISSIWIMFSSNQPTKIVQRENMYVKACAFQLVLRNSTVCIAPNR